MTRLQNSADKEAIVLYTNWLKQAREKQISPAESFNIWLILAGRGWGKTRTGAQDIALFALRNPNTICAVVAPTFGDLRRVCFNGPSGLLSIIPPEYLEKLDAVRQKELVQESKQFDSNALRVAKFLLNEVGISLSMNSQARTQDPQSPKLLTPQAVAQLSNAALSAQKLGKLALGESTENMKLNAEISDTDAFREAMELLDSVAEQRRQRSDSPLH